MMETIKSKKVTYTKHATGILMSEFGEGLKVDLETAKEIVATRLEFANNKKHYVIIDLSNVKEVTPEAKEYLQHPEGGLKNILGAAFLANNPPAELMANIYVKTPSEFPSKFFHDKEDAIVWIKERMEADRFVGSF